MGCHFPKHKQNTIFLIQADSKMSEKQESLILKESEIKNDLKNTALTEKKEFIQNFEKKNKERMARYSNYNNFSTKISLNESKVLINSILLKLHDSSNSLIDEIVITENSIISKYKQKNNNYEKGSKISFGRDQNCDYIINDNSISPIQFYINYNEIKKKFYIFDNLSGTGTFVKLTKEIIIKQNMIISFCVDFMYFDIKKLKNNSTQINIKFLNKFNNSEKQSEISFTNNEYNYFSIGRSDICNYQYNDDSVSKVQCTLIYQNNNWYIYDGLYNEYDKKLSTNGLWLLTKDGIGLKNKMIIKTGNMKIFVMDL